MPKLRSAREAETRRHIAKLNAAMKEREIEAMERMAKMRQQSSASGPTEAGPNPVQQLRNQYTAGAQITELDPKTGRYVELADKKREQAMLREADLSQQIAQKQYLNDLRRKAFESGDIAGLPGLSQEEALLIGRGFEEKRATEGYKWNREQLLKERKAHSELMKNWNEGFADYLKLFTNPAFGQLTEGMSYDDVVAGYTKLAGPPPVLGVSSGGYASGVAPGPGPAGLPPVDGRALRKDRVADWSQPKPWESPQTTPLKPVQSPDQGAATAAKPTIESPAMPTPGYISQVGPQNRYGFSQPKKLLPEVEMAVTKEGLPPGLSGPLPIPQAPTVNRGFQGYPPYASPPSPQRAKLFESHRVNPYAWKRGYKLPDAETPSATEAAPPPPTRQAPVNNRGFQGYPPYAAGPSQHTPYWKRFLTGQAPTHRLNIYNQIFGPPRPSTKAANKNKPEWRAFSPGWPYRDIADPSSYAPVPPNYTDLMLQTNNIRPKRPRWKNLWDR